MGKGCKFSASWKDRDDFHGAKIGDWAIATANPFEAKCKVCNCCVNVKHKGAQALTQHAGTPKHRSNMQALSPDQLRLKVVESAQQVQSESRPSAQVDDTGTPTKQMSPVQIYSVRDGATRAEILWTLKCVASNFSASSCDGLSEIFTAMFDESETTKRFILGRTKVTYLVNEALAPYYFELQKKDMSDSFYTLLFDETTNSAGRKELQTQVRYWSDRENQVVGSHLQTSFLGEAKAKNVKDELDKAIDKADLSLAMMLMLGMDGPNVNKTVQRLFSEELKRLRGKGFVDIGSCNIHCGHNAFRKGMHELGDDASTLLYHLHEFFNDWPSRWEVFCSVCDELNVPVRKFIRHVPQRWLTIEGAGERALELWPAVNHYFLKEIPKREAKASGKTLSDSQSCRCIVTLLNKPTIKAELLFVVSSAKMFKSITCVFQEEEPLIHLLYLELKDLCTKLINKCCKTSKLPFDDMFKSGNLLSLDKIVLDESITSELKALKNEGDQKRFVDNARNHYIECCKYLYKNSAESELLNCLKCLHPAERKKTVSIEHIVTVANALPLDVSCSALADEWRLSQLEKEPPLPEAMDSLETMRIDHYWRHFFLLKNPTGGPKYPTLTKVVKAALTLSHGQGDVERGFSDSGRVLTDDRASMQAKTLNSYLTIKSELKRYDEKPHLMPISKDLMDRARRARQSYEEYLLAEREKKAVDAAAKAAEEEEKREEEERLKAVKKERKRLEDDLKTLQTERGEEEEKLRLLDRLLGDADKRLQEGIKNKDMEEITLAQAMLTTVRQIHAQAQEKRATANATEKRAEKRTYTLINKAHFKKPKN